MSLDPPAFIVSLQTNIRGRPVSWEGAVRAKTITDEQLKQIKSVDKVRKEQRRQTIESNVDSYVKLFFGGDNTQSIFQAAAKREDVTQALLVLVGDLINDIEPFTQALLSHPDPYAPLLPFLKNNKGPEQATPILTSVVVSSLLSHAVGAATTGLTNSVEEAINKLQQYLSSLAQSSDASLQDIAVQEYSAILRDQQSRELFWEQRSETLAPLVDILRSAAGSALSSSASSVNGDSDTIATNGSSTLRPMSSSRNSIRTLTSDSGALSGNVSIQLLYHVLLVIWQLSFSPTLIGAGLHKDHDIIPLYTTLLKISPKEKLTRLILSTLNNLFSSSQNADLLLPAATASRLPALLGNLKTRHLTDEDLAEDLKALKDRLDEYANTQTTLSTYVAELKSGSLRWSPPHRNAQFWSENARAIIENDKGALLKQLAEVLGEKYNSERKEVLAVACNDVACLVREVPEKKTALEKAGLKARVMELMQCEDEAVRWEALQATGQWLRYSFDG